jgi:predicted CoA-binding protein
MPSVAIVGASAKADRYSHQAVLRYRERGWTVHPVHPSRQDVAGLPCLASLAELPGAVDIVCMYVNPETGLTMLDDILARAPQLLWLNPGADGEPLASRARERGLQVIEACTLVVLAQGDPLALVERAKRRS